MAVCERPKEKLLYHAALAHAHRITQIFNFNIHKNAYKCRCIWHPPKMRHPLLLIRNGQTSFSCDKKRVCVFVLSLNSSRLPTWSSAETNGARKDNRRWYPSPTQKTHQNEKPFSQMTNSQWQGAYGAYFRIFPFFSIRCEYIRSLRVTRWCGRDIGLDHMHIENGEMSTHKKSSKIMFCRLPFVCLLLRLIASACVSCI